MPKNCDCKTRPIDGRDGAYFKCNLCQKPICIHCLKGDEKEKDIEDEDNREHEFCKELDVDGSTKSDESEVHNINEETPKRKQQDADDESDDTEDNDEQSSRTGVRRKISKNTVNQENIPSVPTVSKGTRAMPDALQAAVHSKDRANQGFDIKKESDMKATHRPSYQASRRVINGVAEKAAINYCRMLKTKVETPESNLEVSFQIKSKITNNAGVSSYHLFEIGDVSDFIQDKNIEYSNIGIPKTLSNQIRNLSIAAEKSKKKKTPKKTPKKKVKKKKTPKKKVEAKKKNSKDIDDSETDTDESDIKIKPKLKPTLKKKDKKVKSPEDRKRKRKEQSDSDFEDNKRKKKDQSESESASKAEDSESASKAEDSDKSDESPRSRRVKVTPPPMVQVTPAHAVRAPFNRTSGQGLSVQKPPKKLPVKTTDKTAKKLPVKTTDKTAKPKSSTSSNASKKSAKQNKSKTNNDESLDVDDAVSEVVNEDLIIPGPSTSGGTHGQSAKTTKTLGVKRSRGRPKKDQQK